jgi:hypothetical protein
MVGDRRKQPPCDAVATEMEDWESLAKKRLDTGGGWVYLDLNGA